MYTSSETKVSPLTLLVSDDVYICITVAAKEGGVTNSVEASTLIMSEDAIELCICNCCDGLYPIVWSLPILSELLFLEHLISFVSLDDLISLIIFRNFSVFNFLTLPSTASSILSLKYLSMSLVIHSLTLSIITLFVSVLSVFIQSTSIPTMEAIFSK